jgi:hypothetical protein
MEVTQDWLNQRAWVLIVVDFHRALLRVLQLVIDKNVMISVIFLASF